MTCFQKKNLLEDSIIPMREELDELRETIFAEGSQSQADCSLLEQYRISILRILDGQCGSLNLGSTIEEIIEQLIRHENDAKIKRLLTNFELLIL